jgi:hypothetical protein
MGIYEAIKDAIVVAQKADNVDLQKQLLALQTQVIELVEENRALKSQLTTRAQLKFERNGYTLNGERFCSACWDKDGKLVHLREPSVDQGGSPWCPACKQYAPDPTQKTDRDEPGDSSRRSPWS